MSITAALTGNITLTDSVVGTQQLIKSIASLIFTGTNSSVAQSQNIGASPTTITLPISPTKFVYIKNLHAVNTLTVTWTPNGGASNQVVTLQPSEAIIFCGSNTSGGITALSLQASGASTPVEYILAG
jgi:hypothetical protein